MTVCVFLEKMFIHLLICTAFSKKKEKQGEKVLIESYCLTGFRLLGMHMKIFQ